MGKKTAKELDYICIWSDDDRKWIEYNPHDDLNQMVVVVEKLAREKTNPIELIDSLFAVGIKQAFRDFIISTMEKGNGTSN